MGVRDLNGEMARDDPPDLEAIEGRLGAVARKEVRDEVLERMDERGLATDEASDEVRDEAPPRSSPCAWLRGAGAGAAGPAAAAAPGSGVVCGGADDTAPLAAPAAPPSACAGGGAPGVPAGPAGPPAPPPLSDLGFGVGVRSARMSSKVWLWRWRWCWSRVLFVDPRTVWSSALWLDATSRCRSSPMGRPLAAMLLAYCSKKPHAVCRSPAIHTDEGLLRM